MGLKVFSEAEVQIVTTIPNRRMVFGLFAVLGEGYLISLVVISSITHWVCFFQQVRPSELGKVLFLKGAFNS
jgi:hypothetical protein